MSDKARVQKPGGTMTPQEAGQLNDQLAQARALREAQAVDVQKLQQQLFAGQITQKQYDMAIGAQFDAQLAQLAGDKAEQGNAAAAAAVPVGIGQLSGQAQQEYEAQGNYPAPNPNAPPQGVDLSGGKNMNVQPPTGDAGLVAGPGNPADNIRTGANMQGPGVPVPQQAYQWLPMLIEAAKAPDAPPQLIQLVQYLSYHMGR